MDNSIVDELREHVNWKDLIISLTFKVNDWKRAPSHRIVYIIINRETFQFPCKADGLAISIDVAA